MNKKLLLIVFLFCNLYGIAQETREIKGRLLNSETNQPIPFANVTLANQAKGTMSNQEGYFQLYIGHPQANTRINISCLGYQSLFLQPQEIVKMKTIKLKAIAYNLSEVKVNGGKLMKDPRKILRACMKAAPGFRPDHAFINKGFLRQSHLLDKKYVKLIEAALFTYATPEQPKFKVHILEKRNTYDNREIDAKTLGFFKNWDQMAYKKAKRKAETYNPSQEELLKLIQETDEKRNPISKLRRLETAYQPKLGDMWYSLQKLYRSNFHHFKLDTILDWEGEAIYKIKMLPNPKDLKSSSLIHLGYMLISAKDFALYELRYGWFPNPKMEQKAFFANHFKSNFTLKYRKHKGKLYPSYYKYFHHDLTGFTSIDSYEKFKQTPPPHIVKELLFTEIIEEPNRIREMLPQKWNNKLYIPTDYHPQFWENYTILLETEDEAKLREDLEKEIDLKQQFSKSADSIRINQVNN
jgi:hypothetical protein